MDYFTDNETVETLAAHIEASPAADDTTLLELAWYLRHRNSEKAMTLVKRVATKLSNQPSSRGRIALIEAEIAICMARFDAALEHLAAADILFTSVDDEIGLGDSHVIRSQIAAANGDIEGWRGELNTAKYHFIQAGDTHRSQIASAWAIQPYYETNAEAACKQVEELRGQSTAIADDVETLLAMTEGYRAFDTGDFTAAIVIFTHSFEKAQYMGMRLYQIRIAFSISAAHSNLDDKDVALPWLERALDVARETHWPVPLGEALATLGNFYRENGYLERSLETLTEALKWLAVAPNSRGYALAHCYAGHADLVANSFTSAVQHGQEAVQIARRMSSWPIVVDGLIVIALGASQEGNVETALAAAREAVALTEREGMDFWRIDALRALASVHTRHTVSTPQGMDGEHAALHYLTMASVSAEQLGGYGEEVALLIELAAAHEQAGDLAVALTMERRARAASITLERQRLANRMLSSELKHEADLQRREAEYQRRLATSDALTGIPNRRHFLERAALEAQRSARTGNSIALIMADIDRFKSINDTLGHAAGDVVIVGAAHTLAARLRAIDMVGRLGGEEFAILLPDTDGAEAVVIAERLRSDIENMALEWNDQRVPVTMSFGCAACAGADIPNIETLLMQADESLYDAKKSGRNRVVLHRG